MWLISSISLTLGTALAIALPSTANKHQLLSVNTKMTAAKFTANTDKNTNRMLWTVDKFRFFVLMFECSEKKSLFAKSYTHIEQRAITNWAIGFEEMYKLRCVLVELSQCDTTFNWLMKRLTVNYVRLRFNRGYTQRRHRLRRRHRQRRQEISSFSSFKYADYNVFRMPQCN